MDGMTINHIVSIDHGSHNHQEPFDMFWYVLMNICTFSPLSTCILFQVYVFNDPPPSNVQVSGTKMTPPSSMRRIGFYQHDIVICIIWYNMFIICIQYIYMYTVYIHIINMSLHTCIHMYIYINHIYIHTVFTPLTIGCHEMLPSMHD